MNRTPLTNEIKDLVARWRDRELPSKGLLYEYMPFCRGLMYEDEDLVRETTSLLRRNISLWAEANSPAYRGREGVVSKADLLDKSSWYVDSVSSESQPMATSGSTTGSPFSYLRWEPFLYPIEAENHYDLIMDEFDIRPDPEVLYFFKTSRSDPSKALTASSESDNFMEHHGLKRRARVHYVNFDMFHADKDSFFELFFEHISNNPMDVIFAPGPSINAMCHQARRVGFDSRICRLLSNSNEKIMAEDAAFLLDGRVGDICDHMRCWDGGASFFTCRDRNYHLLDNLSWCEEEEGRLVSTDYFSLPSPFVRYWNGDFCRITDRYERCECGRLYRDFEFLENRPFSLKGRSMLEIKATLDSLKIRNIKQIRCSAESIEVVSYSPLQEAHKQILRGRHRFNFSFTVENETRQA